MEKLYCILVLLVTLFGCASGVENKEETSSYKIRVDEITFESEEIAKNSIGANNDGMFTVFLPGNYETSEKDYAVVYYLHGYSANYKDFLTTKLGFEKYNKNNPEKELIVVGVNGQVQNYGSFYSDSKITGNWESSFINEVIPMVEQKYRIKKDKNSRGLAGFSMGGSCSLNIGLKRPDLFGAIYALSPGVLSDVEQLKIAIIDWKNYGEHFRRGYTSAFAEEELDYPEFNSSEEDKELINKWLIGYGSYQKRVEDHLNNSQRNNKIMIAYGEYDRYKWISQGSKWLYEYMNEKNLSVEVYDHGGGHDANNSIIENSMLPFFRDNLE